MLKIFDDIALHDAYMHIIGSQKNKIIIN